MHPISHKDNILNKICKYYSQSSLKNFDCFRIDLQDIFLDLKFSQTICSICIFTPEFN